MTPFNPSLSQTAENHPSASGLDRGAAVDHALRNPPAVAVPADFARRVAELAVAAPLVHPAPRLGWGPALTLASGVLLTVAMFALAPHTPPTLSSLRFDAELVLCAELSGLALFARRLLLRD